MTLISYIDAKSPVEISVHYSDGSVHTMTEDTYADKIARTNVVMEKTMQPRTKRANQGMWWMLLGVVLLTLAYGLPGLLLSLLVVVISVVLTRANTRS